MVYERIHKVQMGVISPSKLRIKLLGTHSGKRKEGSNSSRASPSRIQEMEYSKNSLLAQDADDECQQSDSKDSKNVSSLSVFPSSEIPSLELSVKGDALGYNQGNQTPSFRKGFVPKGKPDFGQGRNQNNLVCVSSVTQPSSNLRTVHPVRLVDEDEVGYDSGCSTNSFEFHREQASQQVVSPFFRNLPSKWNDAEKWISHPQMKSSNLNALKKTVLQNQGNCQGINNRMVVASQPSIAYESHSQLQQSYMRRSNSSNKSLQNVVEKSSLIASCTESSLESTGRSSCLTDSSISSGCGGLPCINKDVKQSTSSFSENCTTKSIDCQTGLSVSMRDIGTEMTPIPSQDPSRIGTPIGATTPTGTPFSSIQSSPKRDALAKGKPENKSESQNKVGKPEISERELQLKIRKEIAALGIKLGKIRIASWASKENIQNSSPSPEILDATKKEYEVLAATWEESQKSKYTARFKQEEERIKAWESQEKQKHEAKMRKVEAQAERMKLRAGNKLIQKLALTNRRVEQKKTTAESRRNKQAAITSKQVDLIRRTGRIPASHVRCYNCFFKL